MGLKSYSDQHLARLSAAVAKVGASLDDLEGKSYGPRSHKGPMIMSADPGKDNLSSRLVEVSSIQQLKDIGGVADAQYKGASDRHIRYPEGAPKTDLGKALLRAREDDCALESLIHPEDRGLIGQAMLAFVNGDSAKVKEFEPVINALHFPSQILVAVGEDITVTAANPLIIGADSPYVQGGLVVFGTVTVEPGGQIQILIPVTFEAAQMVMN